MRVTFRRTQQFEDIFEVVSGEMGHCETLPSSLLAGVESGA